MADVIPIPLHKRKGYDVAGQTGTAEQTRNNMPRLMEIMDSQRAAAVLQTALQDTSGQRPVFKMGSEGELVESEADGRGITAKIESGTGSNADVVDLQLRLNYESRKTDTNLTLAKGSVALFRSVTQDGGDMLLVIGKGDGGK